MDDYVNVFDSDAASDVGGGNVPPKWYPNETSLDNGTIVVRLMERLASQKEDWPDTWIVATSDGRLLRLPTQTRIRRATKNMEVGTYLRIVYQGDVKLKTGPGTFKGYEIKILEPEKVAELGWDFTGTPHDEDVALQSKKSEAYKSSQTGGMPPSAQATLALRKTVQSGLTTVSVKLVENILTEVGVVNENAEEFLRRIGLNVVNGQVDLTPIA